MKIRFADLYTWSGQIDRFPYFIWGCLLVFLKSNADRYVGTLFQQHWDLDKVFLGPLPDLVSSKNSTFLMVLALLALPFCFTGLALTVKRLRSARLPLWLTAVFFLPYVNLLFFWILSLLPERTEGNAAQTPGFFKHFIPKTGWGSAMVGTSAGVALGLLMVLIVVNLMKNYGWTLFVGIPFFSSMISVMFFGYHKPRSLGEAMLVALMAVAMLAFGLLVLALEGIICILMAAPLAVPIGLFGGFVGYLIQRREPGGPPMPATTLGFLMLLPMTGGLEQNPQLPLNKVVTVVEVAAPPLAVWENLVAFPPLDGPRYWLFRAGIAYPTHATIQGSGPGAVRHCNFSTGTFVEPVTVWDPPRQLRFQVTEQPHPLRELSPYGAITPRHLSGYFRTVEGEFLLEEKADGGTRLIGTTWYHQDLRPYAYWEIWTQHLIHKIHGRVLNHIKKLAENPPS